MFINIGDNAQGLYINLSKCQLIFLAPPGIHEKERMRLQADREIDIDYDVRTEDPCAIYFRCEGVTLPYESKTFPSLEEAEKWLMARIDSIKYFNFLGHLEK